MNPHPTCVCSSEHSTSAQAPCHAPNMCQFDEDTILCLECGHEEGCHQPQLALCECTGAEPQQ